MVKSKSVWYPAANSLGNRGIMYTSSRLKSKALANNCARSSPPAAIAESTIGWNATESHECDRVPRQLMYLPTD